MTIAALVGHQGRSITSRYVHSADAVLLAAADAVADRSTELMGERSGAPQVAELNALAGEIDKMAAPTLKSALNNYLGRPHLTEADRAHLKRWLDEVGTPRGWKLAADANRCGELPALVEGPYSLFIGSALRARRFAESQHGYSRLAEETEEATRAAGTLSLLELAEKMEEVVRRYGGLQKSSTPCSGYHRRRVPCQTYLGRKRNGR